MVTDLWMGSELTLSSAVVASDEAEADISQHFKSCHAFIDEAKELKKKVLVHCGAGASRSATICAAYLIKERGWKADETVRYTGGSMYEFVKTTCSSLCQIE